MLVVISAQVARAVQRSTNCRLSPTLKIPPSSFHPPPPLPPPPPSLVFCAGRSKKNRAQEPSDLAKKERAQLATQQDKEGCQRGSSKPKATDVRGMQTLHRTAHFTHANIFSSVAQGLETARHALVFASSKKSHSSFSCVMSHAQSLFPLVLLPQRVPSPLGPLHVVEQPCDPRTGGQSSRLAKQGPLTGRGKGKGKGKVGWLSLSGGRPLCWKGDWHLRRSDSRCVPKDGTSVRSTAAPRTTACGSTGTFAATRTLCKIRQVCEVPSSSSANDQWCVKVMREWPQGAPRVLRN